MHTPSTNGFAHGSSQRDRAQLGGEPRRQSLAQISAADPDVQWPGCEVSAERRKRALRDLLTDLPEEQADALALRVMLGWSLEDVAQATGAPLNTVRSRVPDGTGDFTTCTATPGAANATP